MKTIVSPTSDQAVKFLAHSSLNLEQAPHQSLKEHADNVASLASEKATHFNCSALAYTMGLLHDLGKYSLPFQERLMGGKKRVDHSTWGAKLATQTYGPIGYFLAYGIAGHHAGLANGNGFNGERRSLNSRLEDKTLPPLEAAWRNEISLPSKEEICTPLQKIKPYEACEPFSLTFLTRMLFSALVDADYLDTEKYYDQFTPEAQKRSETRSHTPPTLPELRSELDRYLSGFKADTEVNRIRTEILSYARQQASEEPGLFSLNVPTGGGKTLTSLAFALDHAIKHGQRRVIFVIPFTSIVEQNAAVFRHALGRWGEHAVLEHHSAFSAPGADKGDPERYQSQQKLRLAMENWDAPIVVTTAVQFFESLFGSRPSECRKLHNVSNAVVVLDEVQTVPLKVLRPVVAALSELATNYRSSIVLCTATQPALEAPKFIGGFRQVRPLVKDAATLERRLERVRVSHVGTLDDSTLSQKIRQEHQVLCIVNNRLHARSLYQSLSDLPGTWHLSTLMCARHRSQVLAEIRQCLTRKQDCRVISTSLVEAGVDISFPRVMRAEAGLDSIAQAAGRCNRNKEWPVEDSMVMVFANANPDWAPPPELTQFAQAAQEVLRKFHNSPLSTKAIQSYFELLYWQQGKQALDAKAIMAVIAESQIHNLPMEEIAQKFRMIESHQRTVIIGWDDTARKALQALRFSDSIAGLARALQPYTVQIPQHGFEALLESGAVQAVSPNKWGEQFMELVNLDIYSNRYGLSWDDPHFMQSVNLVV